MSSKIEVTTTDTGIQFGGAWFSHERITGYTAEQLNAGTCGVTGHQYMKWLAGIAAPVVERQPVETGAGTTIGLLRECYERLSKVRFLGLRSRIKSVIDAVESGSGPHPSFDQGFSRGWEFGKLDATTKLAELQATIAQRQGEPVAWIHSECLERLQRQPYRNFVVTGENREMGAIPLYRHPAEQPTAAVDSDKKIDPFWPADSAEELAEFKEWLANKRLNA